MIRVFVIVFAAVAGFSFGALFTIIFEILVPAFRNRKLPPT